MTDVETKWMRKIQKALKECPARLGFYTVGDNCLHVYDRSKEPVIARIMDSTHNMDWCQAVDEVDAALGVINFPCPVHSTAG